MIEIKYADAQQLAYLEADNGLFGPINSYVLGAPSDSVTSNEFTVDSDFIITRKTSFPDNECDHQKTDGLLVSQPLMIGSVQRVVSTKGGYYLWEKGYTSVLVSTSPTGAEQEIETATAMMGQGSSDFVLWLDAFGHPTFTGLIGGSLMGERLHTFWLSGKPRTQGSSTLNQVLEYTHYIYDLKTLNNTGTSYTIEYDCYSTSYRNISIDLSEFSDVFSIYSLIESELQLRMRHSSKNVSVYWKSNNISRAVSDYSNYLSLALRNGFVDLSSDLEPKSYEDLVAEAVSTAPSNETNMISFIRDMRHPTEMIPKLRNLKQLKSLKRLSSEYLGINYGILPTISDLNAIWASFHVVKYLDRDENLILTAGSTDSVSKGMVSYTSVRRVKLAVAKEDSAVQSIYQRLVDVGIFPTFVNLWDLVPYSFVIDWFVDIGDLLKRIDQKIYFSTLNIAYATTSQKDVTEYSFVATNDFPFSGKVTQKGYHRRVSNHCPAPTLSGPKTTRGFDHYVEAGALILQRTHK